MDKFIERLLSHIREHLKFLGITQFSLFDPKKGKGKKIYPPNLKTPLPRGIKSKINRHEQHK